MTRNVEQQREKERDLARQVEELRGQLRLKEAEVDRLMGKSDNSQYYQRTLEGEMQSLRQENQRLLEQLNEAKTEEVKSEKRKSAYEIEILDMKRAL